MKKIIYYVIGIVLVIAIGIFIYILIIRKSSTQQSPTQQNQITIQTNQGSFPIDNVTKSPTAKQLSPTDALVQSNSDYDIVYFDFGAKNRSFLISINSLGSEDIATVRQKAEADFLQSLGITKKQACLLNVSLRVSKDINENLADTEFGLSFCPNGKSFPK